MYLMETFWVHEWDDDIHHLIQYLDNQGSVDVADWLAIRILCIFTLPCNDVFIALVNGIIDYFFGEKINQLVMLKK